MRRSRLRLKQAASNFVSLGEIFFSLERGPAHSAFLKDVLEAAFQVHPALARTRASLQAALFSSPISLKTFELGMPSYFAIARPLCP